MKSEIIALSLFLTLSAFQVSADTCVGMSTLPATNQHYKVDGQFNPETKEWNYVLTDVKTGTTRIGPMPSIKSHAHLYFFLSKDGETFAVLDGAAEHHLTDRFMLYTCATGKLVASLGVYDILSKDQQTTVSFSTCHICFLNFSRELQSFGQYVPDKNAVSLTTSADQAVLISMADGKLLKHEE